MGDRELTQAIAQAVDMVQQQLQNPDVYNDDTHRTLSKVSALAGYLSQKAAEVKLAGGREQAAYLESMVKSLNYLINDLKYKIKASLSN